MGIELGARLCQIPLRNIRAGFVEEQICDRVANDQTMETVLHELGQPDAQVSAIRPSHHSHFVYLQYLLAFGNEVLELTSLFVPYHSQQFLQILLSIADTAHEIHQQNTVILQQKKLHQAAIVQSRCMWSSVRHHY